MASAAFQAVSKGFDSLYPPQISPQSIYGDAVDSKPTKLGSSPSVDTNMIDKKTADLFKDPEEDMGEVFYNQQTADEMEAIACMLKLAEKEGLLCEVVYQLIQGKVDNIPEACNCALIEWDI